MPLDIAQLHRRFKLGEPLSAEEIGLVLARAQRLEEGLAWLASCTAATYEGLPRRASKCERARQGELCRTAADLLSDPRCTLTYPTQVGPAVARCREAAAHCDLYISAK